MPRVTWRRASVRSYRGLGPCRSVRSVSSISKLPLIFHVVRDCSKYMCLSLVESRRGQQGGCGGDFLPLGGSLRYVIWKILLGSAFSHRLTMGGSDERVPVHGHGAHSGVRVRVTGDLPLLRLVRFRARSERGLKLFKMEGGVWASL